MYEELNGIKKNDLVAIRNAVKSIKTMYTYTYVRYKNK